MEQTLGKRIMQHRKRLGMTQDQLAERLGVTAQAVSKWENDQSCPDISIIPKLAGIFGITTDALLGSAPDEPAREAEVVDPHEEEESGSGWELSWDSGRKGAFSFALLVLAVGAQLIVAKLLQRDLGFWSALWPSALLIFGLSGLASRFSFVSIGCALFGGYFLLDNWKLLPFNLGGELVFPVVLVLFGLSLLVDALKKPKKPRFKVTHNGNNVKTKDDLRIGSDSFEYSGSFGEAEQFICLPQLREGKISTSFGDYTIDLSGIQSVAGQCCIEASCSFGELTLLVPRRFRVKLNSSTAFAEVETTGHPADDTEGDIYLKAHASFGEIEVRYI